MVYDKHEKEFMHFETKIRLFEDMLLRTKNKGEQQRLQEVLVDMRKKLQKMRWQKAEARY